MSKSISAFEPVSVEGAVTAISGLGVEISDRLGVLHLDARVAIETNEGPLLADVIRLGDGSATVTPLGSLENVRQRARVQFLTGQASIRPSHAFLGRVVDALGNPIDGKGEIEPGPRPYPFRCRPPQAAQRSRLGEQLEFGVRALDCFTPARAGQRLGIFSGAGVGKSALLGMVARHCDCDVSIVALIGERGREVRDFLEDHLGAEGLARSVVIVATSDEPARMRREAAFLAMAMAEYFRDNFRPEGGAHVLCLMDSLTRVAQAQREIGLSAGEPPTTKGYTPSAFSLLPSIIERAGPGAASASPGHISAVFSVLVEGDDHDEPIADAARATLDGHIVLDRRIAERGRLPAVDILRSVSRAMPGVLAEDDAQIVREAKALAASYEDMRELVRIGAYRAGADPMLDRAITLQPQLEDFLTQSVDECASRRSAMARLKDLLQQGEDR
ncbi:MAG: FliI/YscN family ATPase [Pseudomonadota bacterium]